MTWCWTITWTNDDPVAWWICVSVCLLVSLSPGINKLRHYHDLLTFCGIELLSFWWNMMTSSNGTIFRVTGPLCREFTGPGEFPAKWPVTRSFDVFFDLRLNKRLSKQPWGWWFETPLWSLWRQCNVFITDCTGSCWNDNVQCSQRWKFH